MECRARVRPEDLRRLHLVRPIDLQVLKTDWLGALKSADAFIRAQPPDEVGCLYYAPDLDRFVDPTGHDAAVPHYGRPGGMLPRILEDD